MSYIFSIETVYYNAFFAVKNETNVLSKNSIDEFCRIIEEIMPETVKRYKDAQAPIVTFDYDDKDFFIRERDNFCKFGDLIIACGKPITSEKLRTINFCLKRGAEQGAFYEARCKFKEYIMNREGGPLMEQNKLFNTRR